MSGISRRSILATVGIVLTTAGCVTNSDETPDGPAAGRSTGTTTSQSTKTTRTAPPSPTEAATSAGETTASTGETTREDGATTDDWIARASNSPDPDHSISLNNDAAAARTVRVRVVRERTGETVFRTTRAVSAGAEVAVYNLKRADPEGVEAFRICAELVGRATATTDATTGTRTPAETRTTIDSFGTATAKSSTTTTQSRYRDCVTVDTNECYGDAHVTVEEDGALQIIYAIC